MRERVAGEVKRVAGVLTGASATVSRWWRAGRDGVLGAVRVTGAWAKPLVIAFLERLETVLLNASWRKRIHIGATYALIFAFALTSLDFLVGGGFDFGEPRAAEPRSAVHASLNAAIDRNRDITRIFRTERRAIAADEAPAVLSPALAEATQGTVTEVSQRLDTLLEPEAAAHRAEPTRVPVARLVTEAAELQGAGEAQAPAAGDPSLDAAQRSKPAASAETKPT
jgi:hypothetical protein